MVKIKIKHICPLDEKIDKKQYRSFKKCFSSLEKDLKGCHSLEEQKALVLKHYVSNQFYRETLIRRLVALKFSIKHTFRHNIKDFLFSVYFPLLITIFTNLLFGGLNNVGGAGVLLFYGVVICCCWFYRPHKLDVADMQYFHTYEIHLFEMKLLRRILNNKCYIGATNLQKRM